MADGGVQPSMDIQNASVAVVTLGEQCCIFAEVD